MYDNFFDFASTIISIATLLIFIKLVRSSTWSWRDLAVDVFTMASFLFFGLVALRRVLDWPLEVAVLAFTLKMIGAVGVAIHVWTIDDSRS